eukprot:TRINITY_DN6536_c0_g1_i1.p1 TRINITY_DN6536_c0_g1~~TRINITY_DN6536_c0_g1_i1.p1  ORF type:complete len:633 (-),score=189.05 TRINITY_DN6536_c0_g1_i1:129-2027(-)
MAEVGKKGGQGVKGGVVHLVKPSLPSADPMKQKVAKLREEIDKNNDRIKQIKMVVDERRLSGRGRSESQELLTKLGTVRGEITRCLNRKNAIREQLEVQERMKKAMKSQVEAARDKMKLTSVGEIDKQIKTMLDKLNDDDTEPEEQQKLVNSIKQLSDSKKFLNNAKDKIQEMERASAKSNDFGDQLDKISEEMEKFVKEEKELRKKINKVRQAEEEEVADIPALNEEKQACYEVIVECRNTIKQLQEEYNQEFEDYKLKLKEFQNEQYKLREEQQKQREERQQARQAEQKEKQVARKVRQIEIAGAPFSEEILRCDQLIAFLSKYDVPKTKESQIAASATTSPIAFEPGMKMIRRKNQMEDDEENDPLGGSLSRKANQKKKGKKNKVVAPEPKKLNLDMDLLMAFSQIKVTVPATPEEVPPILEEIKTKKTIYQEKQKKALDAITRGERYIDNDDVPEHTSSKTDIKKDSDKVAADDSETNAHKNDVKEEKEDEKTDEKTEEDEQEEEEEAINEKNYEESSKFSKSEKKEDEIHDDVEKIIANPEDEDDIDINSSKFLKNVKKVENNDVDVDDDDNDISQSKFLNSVESAEKQEDDVKHVKNDDDDDDADVENAPQNEILQGEEVEVGSQD